MERDPARALRAWLPHMLLLALTAAVVGLLATVMWPLVPSLVLAGSIALLTYPSVFLPVRRAIGRWGQAWDADAQQAAAAVLATAAVGAAAALAAMLAVWAVFGSWERLADLLHGLLFNDAERLALAVDALSARAMDIIRLYPQLPWTEAEVRAGIAAWLSRGPLATDMLGFLFRGTIGLAAQAALTLVALFYLYAQGAQLLERVCAWLPVTGPARRDLERRVSGIISFVAVAILPRALLHGLACGLIAWLIADAQVLATAAVAAFLALLPLVGPSIAWLPYATVLWSQGQALPAACLAVACLSSSWAIELAFRRLAQRWQADSVWLGFLLFCGLVGGIVSCGVRGVVIGPAAAVATAALLGFLQAVYGRQHAEAS